MAIRLSACISEAPTRRIYVKFGIEDINICCEIPNLVKIGQEYPGTLHEDLSKAYFFPIKVIRH
jgi:hypothetical protein